MENIVKFFKKIGTWIGIVVVTIVTVIIYKIITKKTSLMMFGFSKNIKISPEFKSYTEKVLNLNNKVEIKDGQIICKDVVGNTKSEYKQYSDKELCERVQNGTLEIASVNCCSCCEECNSDKICVMNLNKKLFLHLYENDNSQTDKLNDTTDTDSEISEDSSIKEDVIKTCKIGYCVEDKELVEQYCCLCDTNCKVELIAYDNCDIMINDCEFEGKIDGMVLDRDYANDDDVKVTCIYDESIIYKCGNSKLETLLKISQNDDDYQSYMNMKCDNTSKKEDIKDNKTNDKMKNIKDRMNALREKLNNSK